MGKEFLRQVSEHYFGQSDISRLCFVFPNRRSMVFFTKYLEEEVVKSGRPVIAPRMLTMNDFFYKVSGANKTEKVALLLELFDCYRKFNPQEKLDDFIFWGEVLLSDFDDVDKYFVENPGALFTNVTEFRGIQDDYAYLTDNQRAAIEEFVKHFSKEGHIKENFRLLWNVLFPLYTEFNDRLREKGMSYEGMVYRDTALRIKSEPVVDVLKGRFEGTDEFVFVGLNALNECEKMLLGKMRDARIARFCWDYQSDWLRDKSNKSSFFMDTNVGSFPQDFDLEPLPAGGPKISVIGVPSSVGQTKMLQKILPQKPDISTAVVLPDESLLIPALNSIPEKVDSVNVTMGYPLGGSQIYSLVSAVVAMQMRLYTKDGVDYFYYKPVQSILTNSIFRTLAGDGGVKDMETVLKAKNFYLSKEDLSGIPLSDILFQPCKDVRTLEEYLLKLISAVAVQLKDKEGMELELDFAKDYHECLSSLSKYELPVKFQTFARLLNRMLSSRTVPFKGEPLKGLQIMGPLELRALDFRHLIILSCNEGIFPRHSVSPSFIPPELRKAFGLPTYEYQDAMWAYYFYRALQRAEDVWLLYDSRMKNLKAGEISRYVKQLEMHFNVKLNKYFAKSAVSNPEFSSEIPKTEADVEVIRRKSISPSSLKSYLTCQAKFYYHVVKGLKEDDEELSESLDGRTVGNVFHKTMQSLYKSCNDGIVSRRYLEEVLSDEESLKDLVSEKIKEELHTVEVSGRDIVYRGMVLKYVQTILSRDLELLKDVYKKDSFKILGLEMGADVEMDGFKLYGELDRLDSFEPGTVRVVDYKTGAVKDNDVNITDENAASIVKDVFGTDDSKRPTIALQLLVYDMFVKKLHPGYKIRNAVYSPSKLYVSSVESEALSEVFYDLMREGVGKILSEISDTSVGFARTEKTKTCDYCAFKTLCGR